MTMLSASGLFPRAKPALDRLATHLAKSLQDGKRQIVSMGESRGVSGATIQDQLRRLGARAASMRSAKPLMHVFMSPALEAAPEKAKARFWEQFEEAMRLTRAPFVSVKHRLLDSVAIRDDHEHRVYRRQTDDGKLLNIGNDYFIRERIAVEVCHGFNLRCPPIAHPEVVERWLRKQGRDACADWMVANYPRQPDPAGAKPTKFGPRRVAGLSPAKRQQQTRIDWLQAPDEDSAWAGWRQGSDGGRATVAALREQGIILARGDKSDKAGRPVLMAVNLAGGVHRAAQLINAGAKRDGTKMSTADLRDRLADVVASLPTVAEAKALAPELTAGFEQAVIEIEADKVEAEAAEIEALAYDAVEDFASDYYAAFPEAAPPIIDEAPVPEPEAPDEPEVILPAEVEQAKPRQVDQGPDGNPYAGASLNDFVSMWRTVHKPTVGEVAPAPPVRPVVIETTTEVEITVRKRTQMRIFQPSYDEMLEKMAQRDSARQPRPVTPPASARPQPAPQPEPEPDTTAPGPPRPAP